MVLIFACIMIGLTLICMGVWIGMELDEKLDRERYNEYRQLTGNVHKAESEQDSTTESED